MLRFLFNGCFQAVARAYRRHRCVRVGQQNSCNSAVASALLLALCLLCVHTCCTAAGHIQEVSPAVCMLSLWWQ